MHTHERQIEFEQLVIYRLNKLDESIRDIAAKQETFTEKQIVNSQKVDSLISELNAYKSSAKVAGAVSGFLVAAATLLLSWFRK